MMLDVKPPLLAHTSDAFPTSEEALKMSYRTSHDSVVRTVHLPSGVSHESSVLASTTTSTSDPERLFDESWLRMSTWPDTPKVGRSMGVVDLFCGCGGLTLGLWEAARALGYRCNPLGAMDWDKYQAATFSRNFPFCDVRFGDVAASFSGAVGDPISQSESALSAAWAGADFLVGGPPCQGHSNLNNKTRRTDTRNLLALRMARAAELLHPRFVIVENVPAISNDTHNSVDRLQEQLKVCNGGYDSVFLKLRAEDYGVAQTRHRSFVIAWSRQLSERITPKLVSSTLESLKVGKPREVEWAISGLGDDGGSAGVFDSSPNVNELTKDRIRFLEETGLTELPDEKRPDCHRIKEHNYGSVYGRIKAGLPAPTMTTGFQTMGRGRFVHPSQPRLLTPHEAARIQFFPDFFEFGTTYRAELARAIGNAVPPKLGFVIALTLLSLARG